MQKPPSESISEVVFCLGMDLEIGLKLNCLNGNKLRG